jgi:hypothetical protein
MQASTLKQAIKEAKRFIKLAEAVPMDKGPELIATGCQSYVLMDHVRRGKASGAAKRASMDLSRVLSSLRQNR